MTRELVFTGFSHVAYFMAAVYGAVGLLKPGHPYLNLANLGRFGAFHVLIEAYKALEFKKTCIDRAVIYFATLLGFVLLFAQIALFCSAIVITTAHASGLGAWYASFFVTQDPTHDVAFRLLDHTFGVPGLYNSCVAQGIPCGLDISDNSTFGGVANWPTPFHTALHGMLQFYNVGLLAVGFMIMMYFMATTVAETAQSGVPFGKRFNGAWAPIRLILAIGALTPLSYGLNGAQIIGLYTAKFGSGIGTNGWNTFVDTLNSPQGTWTVMGHKQSLVARPKGPSINTLPEFMFVASVCAEAERRLNGRNIEGYVMGGNLPALLQASDWDDAVERSHQAGSNQIVIRFGEDDPTYTDHQQHIRPVCGELHLPIKSPGDSLVTGEFAARFLQVNYFLLVQDLWVPAEDGNFPALGTGAYLVRQWRNAVIRRMLPVADQDAFARPIPTGRDTRAVMMALNCAVGWNDPVGCADAGNAFVINNGGINGGGNRGNPFFRGVTGPNDSWIATARSVQIDLGRWRDPHMQRLGWGGAGVWYNKLSKMNGAFVSAAQGVPVAHLYPEVMEEVREGRRKKEAVVDSETRYSPRLSNGKMVPLKQPESIPLAVTYYYAQNFWFGGYEEPKGNPFVDTISAVFGLNGLFSIRDNMDVHPLAQLTAVGRGLIESSITNLGFAFGAGVVGGLANILNQGLVATVGNSLSSFASQVAMIGLSLGFILYYILPFLPFLYFFFAAGGWVKAVFEAMIGLPLWALAHVRIDGEGIPGPSGMNGYFLLLDIFLRPILIVIGMVGSVHIFAVQIQVLNEVWDLATSNLAGFDVGYTRGGGGVTTTPEGATFASGTLEFIRGGVDQLFFTVIYTIVVYMVGMSSFKLVNLVPNYILRWANASVSTFGEHVDDPANDLVQYAFLGSQYLMDDGKGAFSGLLGRSR